ncbi:hypothetical protein CVU75_01610, partial [Candidatus Dependentiae bacterium HGW-Dependentiae-1]
TVHDKDVLAIGGLIRTDATDAIKKTPILGDIPLLGWFFKGRTTEGVKTNLTVFIQPIIIQPYLRGGISPETNKYVQFAKASARQGDLFDSVKDPVTRIFFRSGSSGTDDTDEAIKTFVEKNQSKEVDPLIMAKNNTKSAPIETLMTTQVPLKMLPEKPENKTTQIAAQALSNRDSDKTKNISEQSKPQTKTIASQISSTPQKATSKNAMTPAPSTDVIGGQKSTRIATAKQPDPVDKIKELIKDVQNPLRRVQG